MKRTARKSLIWLMTLAMLLSLLPGLGLWADAADSHQLQAGGEEVTGENLSVTDQSLTPAEGDDTQTAEPEQQADSPEGPDKAVRTIMLYDCGSNLETYGGMATYNLMQILRANFSADDDVRFIVMTGGSETWQTESQYLYDPATGTSPEEINTEYNQIWEARGLDAADPAQRGKLVLIDGDGVLGDGDQAKKAKIDPGDYETDEYGYNWFDYEKEDNYEWMSDPEVLKAFINFCAEKYPAENYDLILWDHGGGPTGGFGCDENDPGGGSQSMSFAEIIDALYNNNVVADGGKFDFVDFDACLMNGVELNLALAGCTRYYIASPETEPGYGQDYEGWLNALGEDPDMDTFALGRRIVDDFTAFYDKEEGDGATQDGTLAVADMEKLLASDFVQALTELDNLLNDQSEWFFYDELRSLTASLEYGDMDYIDLGVFASQLGFAYMEANYGNLDENDEIIDTNDYTDCAKSLLAVLNDPAILYARGTKEIHTDAQYYRDADGTMAFGTQGTSGVYIYFPKHDSGRDALDYYNTIGTILGNMPEGDARTFLSNYRLTLLKYALVYYTGQAVTEMIAQEKDKDAVKYGEGFDAVEKYWKSDAPEEGGPEYSTWGFKIEPILDILTEAEGQEAMEEWMETITWGIAREAILRNHISVSSEREASGTAHTIRITDSYKPIVESVEVNMIAELPAYENALREAYPNDYGFFLRDTPGVKIGSIKGSLVCPVDPEKDGYEALIRWLLDENSTWNLPAVEEKWYAIQDEESTLHAVAAEVEDDGIYICTGYPEQVTEMTEDGPRTEVNWHIVYLQFVDGELVKVYFQQDSGGYRDIPVSEMVGELELTPLAEINFFISFYFPISENSFKLSAENAKDVSLIFTDVNNISDIRDTSGDGKGLTTQAVIRNVFGYDMDISDLVAEADNRPAPPSGGGSGSGGSGGVTIPSNPVSLPDPASGTAGGKVTSSAASAKSGDKVTLTLTPDEGWQTAGVTVKDKNGTNVPVTKNDDGTYTFTMPATAVTVTPEFVELPVSDPLPTTDVSDRFSDVGKNAWYHDAVQWAADQGLMNGVSDDTFAPSDTCTRGMVVTMLWRMAGEPASDAGGSFTDVSSGAWFADAVNWAAETGTVNGISATEFAPDAPVTREQLAAILYRYAQAQGKGFTGMWAFPLEYPDASEVSGYADEAMHWMTMHGIITGMADGTLAPRDNATRAQIAAMFMRFCAEMEK